MRLHSSVKDNLTIHICTEYNFTRPLSERFDNLSVPLLLNEPGTDLAWGLAINGTLNKRWKAMG